MAESFLNELIYFDTLLFFNSLLVFSSLLGNQADAFALETLSRWKAASIWKLVLGLQFSEYGKFEN